MNVSDDAKLDAWTDFNGDESFFGAREQIFTSMDVAAGNNTLTFGVPADARQGPTFARFRLSSTGGFAPVGGAPDGEVEDHAVTISNPFGSSAFGDSGQWRVNFNNARMRRPWERTRASDDVWRQAKKMHGRRALRLMRPLTLGRRLTRLGQGQQQEE